MDLSRKRSNILLHDFFCSRTSPGLGSQCRLRVDAPGPTFLLSCIHKTWDLLCKIPSTSNDSVGECTLQPLPGRRLDIFASVVAGLTPSDAFDPFVRVVLNSTVSYETKNSTPHHTTPHRQRGNSVHYVINANTLHTALTNAESV